MTLKRQIVFLGGSCYGIAVMMIFVSTTVYCQNAQSKCTEVVKVHSQSAQTVKVHRSTKPGVLMLVTLQISPKSAVGAKRQGETEGGRGDRRETGEGVVGEERERPASRRKTNTHLGQPM